MVRIPKEAQEQLQKLEERLGRKPLDGHMLTRLDPMNSRKAISLARRGSDDGQTPCALYSPKGQDPLVVMKATDLTELLESFEARTRPSPSLDPKSEEP